GDRKCCCCDVRSPLCEGTAPASSFPMHHRCRTDPHRWFRRARVSVRCAGPGRSTTERPDASARPSPHEWGGHCAGDPGPSKAGTTASRSRSFFHRARVVVSCAVRSHSKSSPVEDCCSGERHCWSKTPLSLGGCVAGSEKSFSGVPGRERSSTLGTGGE